MLYSEYKPNIAAVNWIMAYLRYRVLVKGGLSLKIDAKSGVYFVEVTLIKERAPLSVITSWIEKQST